MTAATSRRPATRCSPRSTRTAHWPPAAPRRPASTKSDAAAQTYTVTFARDVSKCSSTANVVGSSADFSLGVEPGPAANQVRVDQRNVADGNTDGRAFHLQVIC